MHIFTKHCYCRARTIPFRSEDRFDEHAIANVFCPQCADRAPAEGFLVAVTGIPGWSGIYAIDWNQSYLEEKDRHFHDTERYYTALFQTDAVTFGFLPRVRSDRSYDVIGIRDHLPSDILPAGRAGAVMAVAEAPAAARPKPIGRGGRSAKKRPRGYGA